MSATWNCPACAATNGPNDPTCTACGAGRLRGTATSPGTVHATAAAESWRCGACETVNLAPSLACSACGAAKGSTVDASELAEWAPGSTAVLGPVATSVASMKSLHSPAPPPPTPGAALAADPKSAKPNRMPVVVIALIVIAALAVGTAVGVIVSRKSRATAPTTAVRTTHPGGTVVTPASPPPTPAVTQVTPAAQTPGLVTVDTSQVAAGTQTNAVALTFETYFGGIDTQNWNQMYSAYSPRFQANDSESGVEQGLLTTQDSVPSITSIAPQNDGSLIATVNFTSHQSAADGPNGGDTCDTWSIDYDLVTSPNVVTAPNGQQLTYFIDGTTAHTATAC